MLGMRVARQLEQPSNEPLVFTDVAGRATEVPSWTTRASPANTPSSEGKKGDAVWSTRGRWTLLAGSIGTQPITIAMIDHPEEPGIPDLLARARLRTVRREPARAESLQRGARDHEPHAAARRVGDVPLSRGRARGKSAGGSHRTRVHGISPRSMIHVGLIGAGNISDTHARAVSEISGATVAAVHAPTRAHARAAGRASRRGRVRHAGRASSIIVRSTW